MAPRRGVHPQFRAGRGPIGRGPPPRRPGACPARGQARRESQRPRGPDDGPAGACRHRGSGRRGTARPLRLPRREVRCHRRPGRRAHRELEVCGCRRPLQPRLGCRAPGPRCRRPSRTGVPRGRGLAGHGPVVTVPARAALRGPPGRERQLPRPVHSRTPACRGSDPPRRAGQRRQRGARPAAERHQQRPRPAGGPRRGPVPAGAGAGGPPWCRGAGPAERRLVRPRGEPQDRRAAQPAGREREYPPDRPGRGARRPVREDPHEGRYRGRP